MKIVLLGPPGCGKGTNAKLLCEKLSLVWISMGDMLRSEVDRHSTLGDLANQYMSQGKLVPDDVIIKLLSDRISRNDCKRGFILDGFPRNIAQAQELDKIVDDYIVVYLDIKDYQILFDRIEGRMVCKNCGNNKLEDDVVCSVCGGEFEKRGDDSAKTLQKRLDTFDRETYPLKDYYAKQNKLIVVEPKDSIQGTFSEILEKLGVK